MNALNVVWSDIYILQQLTEILQGNLILKFPVKVRDIDKIENKEG